MSIGAWWGYGQTDGMVEPATKMSIDDEQYEKMLRAYKLIASNYVEKIDEEQLAEGAIKGMLAELKDPYSVYMDKKASEQFEQSLDATFQGIGAEVSEVDGKIVIVAPFKNSPAEKAGIRPNDQIVAVDGKEVAGLRVFEVVDKIRGKQGTKVKITILRSGSDKQVTFTITRDEIPLETIHSSIKEVNGKDIGYIEITQFSEKTAKDFKTALTNLEKQNVAGLILDVRGNPGGLLSSVEDILDTLLPKDKPYIQIQDRQGKTEKFYTTLAKKKQYPIVVLIDRGSASAAEILAAAMRDAGGYKLIGEDSFGKGTVQQAVSLGDGSEIKMTFFKWLTPNGKWIHRDGIAPDVAVDQPKYFYQNPLHLKEDLSKNDNSELVKTAQEALIANGFAPGRNDGYFDEQTEVSVKAFQRSANLSVTGTVNQETAEKMQTNIAQMIKDEKNDLQLKAALHLLVTQ